MYDLLKSLFRCRGGCGYTPEEILIVARSYMTVSEDPITGMNQKASAFWTQMHFIYNKNVVKASKKRESNPDGRDLPDSDNNPRDH